MRTSFISLTFLLLLVMLCAPASAGWEKTVYEADSLYHHIRVVDDGGQRMLRFDNSMETTMSIANPYLGHFEYIDFFFQAFCAKPNIKSCCMLGLGGASAPKLMQRHFSDVSIDVAEIDSMVYDVAREYFYFTPAATTTVNIQDARVYLRKSAKTYDYIIMDAYTANKYGSYVPFHLATSEFFAIVNDHLSDDGLFAFNIIGQIYGERENIIASIYKTMMQHFPNIYIFPANSSRNVVMIASKSNYRLSNSEWLTAAANLNNSGATAMYPKYTARALRLIDYAPPNWQKAQLLTDDFAPIDGLLK